MDQQTIDAYNKMAARYDAETKDFWQRFPHAFISKFTDTVSGKNILDVGSGPGRDAELLRKSGLTLTWFDASQTMVNMTSAKGFPSILGDFSKLPFKDNEFDGVWSYTALLHVSKQEINLVLSEVNRVMKHGGVFGLGMIEGQTEEYKVSEKVPLPRLFSYYLPAELEKLLDNAGFQQLYFETIQPNKRRYLHFLLQKD